MSGYIPTKPNPALSIAMISRGLVTAIGAAVLCTLTSCYEKNDPSYEKEVLRLTAEKAVLETKLEASQKKNKEISSSLSTLRTEAASHQQKSSDEALAKLKKLEAALIKRDSDLLKLSQEMAAIKKLAATNVTAPPRPPTQATPTATPPNNANKPWKIEVDRGGNSRSQPTRTGQPATGQGPQKKQTDPNAHKVDWGKAK